MQRFTIFGVLLLMLAACQIAPPVQPIPNATATIVVQAVPGGTALAQPSGTASIDPTGERINLPLVVGGATPTWTPQPTLTPTLTPTITATPQSTLTPLPTITPTSGPVVSPVVLIARPLANEFVPASMTVTGKIANVTSGIVRLSLVSPDGQPSGVPPTLATTEVVTDGLSYSGKIELTLPPTPRPFAVQVQWAPSENAQPAGSATQPIFLLGRYGRVDRLMVEAPKPFERGTDAQLAVRGVAPGPPTKILARLLNDADQVLESVEATLTWNQPGMACAFSATLPNNTAATQLQVISLGPDDKVLETARVRLAPR